MLKSLIVKLTNPLTFPQEQGKGKQRGDLPSVLLKWVVLDGVMHPNWTEGLNTVLDSECNLSLANGGHVNLDSKMQHFRFPHLSQSFRSDYIIPLVKVQYLVKLTDLICILMHFKLE